MTQPVLPLTYTDLVCELDADAFARETTSDFQNLQQDVSHILIETPGSNPDDPDRGIGIDELLSGTEANLRRAIAKIDSELPKDPRIDASATNIVNTDPGDYDIDIQIVVDGQVIGLSFAYSSARGLTTQ